jgi:hypothetical protein
VSINSQANPHVDRNRVRACNVGLLFNKYVFMLFPLAQPSASDLLIFASTPPSHESFNSCVGIATLNEVSDNKRPGIQIHANAAPSVTENIVYAGQNTGYV